MSQEQLGSKSWQRVGITEDANVLNGEIRHHEEQLVKVLKAVSEVFPGDPFPFDGLEQYRSVRRALDEIDAQVQLKSGPFSGTQVRAERDRLCRQALELVEADLRLCRKQKVARMALSHDWSGMPTYLREGVAMWKCRFLLRSGALFSQVRMYHVRKICEERTHSQISPALSRPQTPSINPVVSDSQLRSNIKRLGVAIVEVGPTAVIETGSLSLDQALGIGGFPRGRIVEIFGKGGTGKTTLALAAAANAQRNGGEIAYVDTEHKLDLGWARTNGLKIDEALILQGTGAKAILDSVLELIRSGRFALVVVDSLSALVPGENLEDRHRDFTAEMDQLFSRALPRIAAAAGSTKTCVLLLDQIRHDHEVVFGRDKVSTGGEAVIHASSIRLELTRMMAQKSGDEVTGYGVKGTVLKSCVGAPFRVAQWTIDFERGVDSHLELVEQGISRGVIVKQTVALTFQGESIGANNNAARDFLIQHPDVAARVETRLRAALKDTAA